MNTTTKIFGAAAGLIVLVTGFSMLGDTSSHYIRLKDNTQKAAITAIAPGNREKLYFGDADGNIYLTRYFTGSENVYKNSNLRRNLTKNKITLLI